MRCAYPIPVEVQHVDGAWYVGSALAYCGQRVTVTYTVDVGATHYLVVDASQVRRA
ncbi:MAG: hypothetical protein JWM40_2928 [Frankiales bacterium]|nr:hypothetical protein [Frankiales bacterium]